jgi:hypothetical protein
VLMGSLWLEAPSSSANAISNAINAAPSGMNWLSTVQLWAAHGSKGNGLPIAIILAVSSIAIGLSVALGWHPKPFMGAAVVPSLAYWVLGQGFGGIFEGGATDPNAGLLFVLFAYVMYALVPYGRPAYSATRGSPQTRDCGDGLTGADHEID